MTISLSWHWQPRALHWQPSEQAPFPWIPWCLAKAPRSAAYQETGTELNLYRSTRYADRLRGRGQRQSDPEDDVNQEAGSGEKNRQQPHDPDNGGIQIEIIREARTDAANFFVAARAHQLFRRRRITSSGRSGL